MEAKSTDKKTFQPAENEHDITYDKKPQDILFVLLGVYASNYFIATMSGATSGMA